MQPPPCFQYISAHDIAGARRILAHLFSATGIGAGNGQSLAKPSLEPKPVPYAAPQDCADPAHFLGMTLELHLRGCFRILRLDAGMQSVFHDLADAFWTLSPPGSADVDFSVTVEVIRIREVGQSLTPTGRFGSIFLGGVYELGEAILDFHMADAQQSRHED